MAPELAKSHPERFDPAESSGTLMDSEHRGRYMWGAQLVRGRKVLDAGCGTGYGLSILEGAGPAGLTGLDIDPDAIAAAQGRVEDAEVVQGDLTALEFPDDSFDLAICFETIEHLASPEEGLAELRRVVRPGGILVISSPNPDVYPSGNEHHLSELRPGELIGLVQSHFESTRLYGQRAWLASTIEPVEGDGGGTNGANGANGSKARASLFHTTSRGSTDTTFSIVVGCDEEQPEPGLLVNLGDPFEVRWWEEKVSEATLRAEGPPAEPDAKAKIEEAQTALAATREELKQRELELSRARAEAGEREAQLSERLKEAGSALIDANQELAQLPLLKHRLAEIYRESAAYQAELNQLLGSRSWRITGFLRKVSATFKPQS